MILLTILLAITALALPSVSNNDDIIIDLQELLLNVHKTSRYCGQSLKEFKQDTDNNARSIDEKFGLVIKYLNENAREAGENAKRSEEHAKKHDESLKENTEILKHILTSLGTLAGHMENIGGLPRDCAEIYTRGERSSGTYVIKVHDLNTFPVYCDMTTDGGGWTVFQRRGDFGFPQDYFYKTWNEYKKGFGDLEKEFWLGNDRISALSNQWSYETELKVDLWDMEGNHRYAKYSSFRVENEYFNYTLRIDRYSGDAGDSLRSQHRNEPFSTKDRNSKMSDENCAVKRQGGWWYFYCEDTDGNVGGSGKSNLNGLNLRGPGDTRTGIHWYSWEGREYSLAFTEMKLRPSDF